MIIKNIIFLVVFLISTNLAAQNFLGYYEVINKAEIAALDKNHVLSDSLYQLAFNLVDRPFKEDYYLAALNAEKLNNNTKVYNYLKQGIENGLVLKRVKELESFPKSEHYKKLKQDYQSLRNDYLQMLNIPLRDEIAEMIRKDQRANKNILAGPRKLSEVSKINFDQLLKIIKANGDKWPGFSTIGEITPKGKYSVTDNIALMLLHFQWKEIEILRPYMLEAVLNGDMYPYHYARIIDYTSAIIYEENISNGTTRKIEFCHLYGTYLNINICDCAKAEIERKKIGLEPIKDYYRKRNSTYTCKEN